MKALTICALLMAASLFAGEEETVKPLQMKDAQSPSGRHLISLIHGRDKESGDPTAKLALRERKTKRTLDTVPVEVEGTDDRKDVSVLWSPKGTYLAVNLHLGQLYWFDVFRVVDEKFEHLAEEKMPKEFERRYFTPESQKSRGGSSAIKWKNDSTLGVLDTIHRLRLTYRIGKSGLVMTNVERWKDDE